LILIVPGLEDKSYFADPRQILALVTSCPLCVDGHRLALNGGYPRWIPLEGGPERGWIYRFWCSPQRISLSAHPDFLLERQQYSRPFVTAWLWQWLQGAPARSESFLIDQGISYPPREPLTSWTDHLASTMPTLPGYQLLWRWTSHFNRRAAHALPMLLAVLMALGADVRTVGRAIQKVPRRCNPLCTALSLLCAFSLPEDPEPDAEALRTTLYALVGYLGHPSLCFTPVATGRRAPPRVA